MILYYVCAIIVAILSIILFFKVWGMTSDVKDIKERLSSVFPTENEKKYIEQQKSIQNQEVAAPNVESEFSIGETVRYAPMDRIMIVKRIRENGDVECVSYKQNGKEEPEGVYKPGQIEHYAK